MDRNEYDAAKRFNATMTVISKDFTRFVDEIAKLREAIERKNSLEDEIEKYREKYGPI